jgi:hypothetical protein
MGVMNNAIDSRYGPKPPVQADYLYIEVVRGLRKL